MNYLEKLGIDLTTEEGLGKVTLLTCDDLPCGKDGTCELGTRIFNAKERSECKAKHLLAEVPEDKKPTYRPYKNVDEMMKDFDCRFSSSTPKYAIRYIWVMSGDDEQKNLIIGYKKYAVRFGNLEFSLETLFEKCVYLDGTPCGKLVEE